MSSWHSCAQNGTEIKHKHHLQILSATGPLEFVTMNILGALSKPAKGSQHVVIIADRHLKVTQAVDTARIIATAVACIFSDA